MQDNLMGFYKGSMNNNGVNSTQIMMNNVRLQILPEDVRFKQ